MLSGKHNNSNNKAFICLTHDSSSTSSILDRLGSYYKPRFYIVYAILRRGDIVISYSLGNNYSLKEKLRKWRLSEYKTPVVQLVMIDLVDAKILEGESKQN